jgi:hypothetical protein
MGVECLCNQCKPKAERVPKPEDCGCDYCIEVMQSDCKPKASSVFTLERQVNSQRACIDELLDLIGYLPQGLAVLEKHGVSR